MLLLAAPSPTTRPLTRSLMHAPSHPPTPHHYTPQTTTPMPPPPPKHGSPALLSALRAAMAEQALAALVVPSEGT